MTVGEAGADEADTWIWICSECGERLSDCEWPMWHESGDGLDRYAETNPAPGGGTRNPS